MLSKRIVLLANTTVGQKIVKYFNKRFNRDHVVAVCLPDNSRDIDSNIINEINQDVTKIFIGKEVFETPKFIDYIKKVNPDFLISIYWPWILTKEFLNLFCQTINFHPSLLPSNKGWYPHVYNIINKSKAGVTLHQINEQVDSGPIWSQRKVKVNEEDTSLELYIRLQNEMIALFQESWPNIRDNKIEPQKQITSQGNYNSIKKVSQFDEIKLNKTYTGEEIINLLKARTFGSRGYAFYVKDGIQYNLSLKVNKHNKNDK